MPGKPRRWPRQPRAATTFIVIILAVMLFAWYLTLESGVVWPPS
jgi:hypothetical protein